MTYDRALGVLANWAAILTACVAVFAYGRYVWERHKKRVLLENYLKEEKTSGFDQGQRTVLHLMAHLGMTENDVFDAAFRSKKVRPAIAVNQQGRADALLFEYDGDDIELRRPL